MAYFYRLILFAPIIFLLFFSLESMASSDTYPDPVPGPDVPDGYIVKKYRYITHFANYYKFDDDCSFLQSPIYDISHFPFYIDQLPDFLSDPDNDEQYISCQLICTIYTFSFFDDYPLINYGEIYGMRFCRYLPPPTCSEDLVNPNDECIDWQGEKWANLYEFKRQECYEEYGFVRGPKSRPKGTVRFLLIGSRIYCDYRYSDSSESEDYDEVQTEYEENEYKDILDILPEDDDIDIRQELGIGKNGTVSLSSAFPDFLGTYYPNKPGIHGLCLRDIQITVLGMPVVLEISRICPYLRALGNIFLVVSLLVSYKIIAGLRKPSRFHNKH